MANPCGNEWSYNFYDYKDLNHFQNCVNSKSGNILSSYAVGLMRSWCMFSEDQDIKDALDVLASSKVDNDYKYKPDIFNQFKASENS